MKNLDQELNQRLTSMLNSLQSWPLGHPTVALAEAEGHAKRYGADMMIALEHIRRINPISPFDAMVRCAAGGHNLPQSGDIVNAFLDCERLLIFEARAGIAMDLASHLLWDRDPDLRHLPSPFGAQLRLLQLGYGCVVDMSTLDANDADAPEVQELYTILEWTTASTQGRKREELRVLCHRGDALSGESTRPMGEP
jgi:hypothetical protein